MTEKIIFDCDNTMSLSLKEVDDGLALLYLLGSPDLEVLGVTTTFGKGHIDQVYSQTTWLDDRLHLAIPILKGESGHHLGERTPAAEFLVEMVRSNPGEITILATGSVSNLHAAAKLDPEFFYLVKRITVMGGYLSPLKLGYRNLKELNFSANPKASLALLTAVCPVTVFSAQACLDAPYRLRNIQQADYWSGWIKRMLIQWLITFGLYTGEMVFYHWDLLPAVYLNAPHLFNVIPIQIGSTLADMQKGMLRNESSGTGPIISLATEIKDQKGFYQQLDIIWQNAMLKYIL